MNPPIVSVRSLLSVPGFCLRAALLLTPVTLPNAGWAQITLDSSAAHALPPKQKQRLDSEFKARIPGASRETIERAEKAFLDHLSTTSSMAADQLASGKIDADDLSSRIDVFMGDHPELAGSKPAAAEGGRAQVMDALKQYADLAKTDAERQALADRFVVWIGGLSSTARDTLLAGRMSSEELQSRVEVFAADIRTERTTAAVDPAVAAVPAIAEAFEKANLGPVPERADSICCRGTVSEGSVTREFVMFKRRPGSIRINIVEHGLVVGVLAFDGTTAWRQVPGRSPTVIHGAEVDNLVGSGRFDDPLVGYRERGARARLESAPGESPIRLSIREAGGSEVVEVIDPKTYHEISQSRHDAAGKVEETRFRDYKTVGPFSYAAVEERWVDGALRSTTNLSNVTLDSGVLARVFVMPTNPKLDFMDYMGGLAIIEKVARKNTQGIQLPAGVAK
jgi:hypothetical protein